MQIRYAKVEDAAIIANIHIQSWKVAYQNIVPDEVLSRLDVNKRTAYFTRVLEDASEMTALIFVDSEPIGIVTFGHCRDEDLDDSYGEIWGIYLAPDFFHQGYGSKLINWAINELKNQNYQNVSLWVLEENLKARTFYEKMGFKNDGTIKELNFNKILKEIRYIKRL